MDVEDTELLVEELDLVIEELEDIIPDCTDCVEGGSGFACDWDGC